MLCLYHSPLIWLEFEWPPTRLTLFMDVSHVFCRRSWGYLFSVRHGFKTAVFQGFVKAISVGVSQGWLQIQFLTVDPSWILHDLCSHKRMAPRRHERYVSTLRYVYYSDGVSVAFFKPVIFQLKLSLPCLCRAAVVSYISKLGKYDVMQCRPTTTALVFILFQYCCSVWAMFYIRFQQGFFFSRVILGTLISLQINMPKSQ